MGGVEYQRWLVAYDRVVAEALAPDEGIGAIPVVDPPGSTDCGEGER